MSNGKPGTPGTRLASLIQAASGPIQAPRGECGHALGELLPSRVS